MGNSIIQVSITHLEYCVRVRVRVRVCVRACARACARVRVCACVHVCVCACMHICIRVCIHTLWNQLPITIKSSETTPFLKKLKTYLFEIAFQPYIFSNSMFQ